MVQTIKMSIKLGDTVEVITGFEKKKTGKVIKLFRSTGKILIQGINLKFKHVKPTKEGKITEFLEITFIGTLVFPNFCR